MPNSLEGASRAFQAPLRLLEPHPVHPRALRDSLGTDTGDLTDPGRCPIIWG